MASVLFGLLCHEADVGDVAHCGPVKLAVLQAVLDASLGRLRLCEQVHRGATGCLLNIVFFP